MSSKDQHVEARTLLRALAGAADGYLTITTFPDRVSRSFHTTEIEAAASYSVGQRKKNVYVGLGVRNRPFYGNERGTGEDVGSLSLVWTEIDIADPIAHKKDAQRLPRDRSAALALLEDFGLKPSGVIDSGYGLHVYWLLESPLTITTDQERAEAKVLVADFQRAFKQHAAEHGFHIDATQDLARVMRVPGTYNVKNPAEPKLVKILEWSDSRRYAIDELPLLPKSKAGRRGKKAKPRAGQKKASESAGNEHPPSNAVRVIDGCLWLAERVRDDAENLSEPEWHAAATIIGRTRKGRQHFHTLSKPYPGYHADETDDKPDRIDEAGPRSCESIRNDLGGEPYCSRCPFYGGIRTPLQLGQPADPSREINTALGDLPEQSAKSWAALHRGNTGPSIFTMSGHLVRLERDDEGRLRPQQMRVDHMRHHVARAATWTTLTARGGTKLMAPPDVIVKDMLVAPEPPVPVLTGVTEVPLLSADGHLVTKPGYSRSSRRWLQPFGPIPPVPSSPTRGDIAKALDLLQNELLGDFAFVNESDRAHALAALLLPFGRDLIDGPTPLHLIEKPMVGSGATLLAEVLLHPVLGATASVLTVSSSEEEMRKRITAKMLQLPQAVVFDNLPPRVDSPALAAAITAWPNWTDRVLGTSSVADIPMRAVLVATGNNPQLSLELARRIVRVRIDPKRDKPWLRSDFRHVDLRAWVAEHRAELVWAALVLWNAWLSAGRSPGKQTPLGSFSNWSHVMGGVLDVAGVAGFLDNLTDFYENNDAEGPIRAFITAWWDRCGSKPVTAKQVVDIAVDSGIEFTGRDDYRSTELGKMLANLRDRRFDISTDDEDGATVTVAPAGSRGGVVRWQLRQESTTA